MRTNRLINEKSPYLLQHAHNPVDWYPWGDEAFQKARHEDKPIFLSIGYSTCYWCHVMEREVFENETIAEAMNRTVISIKVDREERPDIDRIYMGALQAMTGSGGWPMSMFLTPDRKPFFGATYIPPETRHGRAGFPEILARIHEIWNNDRANALEAGEQLTTYLKDLAATGRSDKKPDAGILDQAYAQFQRGYDPEHAGFGRAPKFPRPVAFNFLLRYYKRTGVKEALEMTLSTLHRMSNGGIYDHVGGGFHRYATDRAWHVPHFEKMLYDQAQMVISLLETFQITHDPRFATTARDVLRFVSAEMTDPRGGFYSAIDAESLLTADGRKKEGAYYVWDAAELRAVLSNDEYRIAETLFGIRDGGNVVADPHGEFTGLNILHKVRTDEEVCQSLSIELSLYKDLKAGLRWKLQQARSMRPRPHLDDKILVSWNGLMISAFARASQVLGDMSFAQSGEKAARFILETMARPGSLKRRYRDGETKHEAQLEDYAFLVQGLIDLYEATFSAGYAHRAISLTDDMIGLFGDTEGGGFFDTTESDPSVLLRTREFYDGAEPSGGAIAVLNLLRLSQMTKREDYLHHAESALRSVGERLSVAPEAGAQYLVGVDFLTSQPHQIIVAGQNGTADLTGLLAEIHRRFIPNKVMLLADRNNQETALLPLMDDLTMIDGRATAYVCRDYVCKLPVTNPEDLSGLLDE